MERTRSAPGTRDFENCASKNTEGFECWSTQQYELCETQGVENFMQLHILKLTRLPTSREHRSHNIYKNNVRHNMYRHNVQHMLCKDNLHRQCTTTCSSPFSPVSFLTCSSKIEWRRQNKGIVQRQCKHDNVHRQCTKRGSKRPKGPTRPEEPKRPKGPSKGKAWRTCDLKTT